MKLPLLLACVFISSTWAVAQKNEHNETAVTNCAGCKEAVNKLQNAWNNFSNDAQLKYALAGICVMDAQTGRVLFEKNSNIGMAPASCQKVITSIASFEAFGPSFQYLTTIGYTGKIVNRKLAGDLIINASGDPSFASPRYTSTKQDSVLLAIFNALKKAGIDAIEGNIITTNKGFDINPTPEGWIWSDIGNYYGAGVYGLNWNENQYDLLIKTGANEKSKTEIIGSKPEGIDANIINDVKTGTPGTGDGSVIYGDAFNTNPMIQGKLEPNKSSMTVSGSLQNADEFALKTIRNYLEANGIPVKGETVTPLNAVMDKTILPASSVTIGTIKSPTLDSLVYWFMRKSINLYGEALVRKIGSEKKNSGTTGSGLEWIDSLYTSNGFDTEAMHLYDGSGLSPANRITPFALAKALYYAKSKTWFPYFYDALPTYNNMKLKSGTINRVKSFAGYHTSKAGTGYVVTIMVNNYNSSHSALVNKMFAVLDCLK